MGMNTPLALLAVCALACGGAPAVPPAQSLSELRAAIESSVTSAEASAQSSRLVDQIADDDVLQGMRRIGLEEAIGRGDTCSRHPRCAENGFDAGASFYRVGNPSDGYSGPVPELIVGFNREGFVDQVWNFRTHE